MADWEHLRGLVRRYLVAGIDLHDGGYDSPRSHSNGGLDTQARCELVSVLMALRLIRTQGRVAHQLLVRDIGRPCRSRHVGQGHCHRIPIGDMPALQGLTWQEIEERTEKAVEWLVSLA